MSGRHGDGWQRPEGANAYAYAWGWRMSRACTAGELRGEAPEGVQTLHVGLQVGYESGPNTFRCRLLWPACSAHSEFFSEHGHAWVAYRLRWLVCSHDPTVSNLASDVSHRPPTLSSGRLSCPEWSRSSEWNRYLGGKRNESSSDACTVTKLYSSRGGWRGAQRWASDLPGYGVRGTAGSRHSCGRPLSLSSSSFAHLSLSGPCRLRQ